MTAAEMVLERPGAATQGSAQRIEIDNVSLRYFTRQAEILALSGISLSIEPGEFVSLIGQSGCGKSTLLSIIAGILPPSDGEVRVGGRRVTAPSPRIGYMLQQLPVEWRTILITLCWVPNPEARHERSTIAVRLLEKWHGQLSGSVSARCRAVCASVRPCPHAHDNPDVVLLDELLGARFTNPPAIADEVVNKGSEGKSVVLVTHDIGEAISMTDRVVVLSRRPGASSRSMRSRSPVAGGVRRRSGAACRLMHISTPG